MSDATIIITTANGSVKGIKKTSTLGTSEYEYYSFQGIPYAKPPIGNLRFKDPEPVDDWSDVIDATKQGPGFKILSLLSQGETTGNEDSLHINIFTKNITPSKPLPVMVWIHGGAFMTGSSGTEMYGPDYLIEKNVVLVSLNYRLGAFGFLSLSDTSLNVPGNAGLKDQSLALKWIRKNIAAFGGDAKNITLFGESAGGCSVHYHMISDMSKNLFDRAIAQSGTTLMSWSVLTATSRPLTLAKKLGWTGNDKDEKGILELLRATDADKIVFAQEDLRTQEEIDQKVAWSFGPVIEPYIGEQCFVPEAPKLMCRKAWSNSIPLLIGGTSHEGLMFHKEYKTDPTIIENTNFEDLVPRELGIVKGSEKSKRFAEEMKKLYFGSKVPNLESILEYCDVMSDKIFWHGLHRTILSRVNAENAGPTYLYRFNVDSNFFSFVKILFCGKEVRGTCHGDDISYLFANFLNIKLDQTTLEYKTVQRMVEIWTEFATSGNPNASILSPVKWDPLSVKEAPFKCLNIGDEIEIIELPETKRNAFWDSMYEGLDQLY